MNVLKISRTFVVAGILVFTVAFVTGCGEQNTASQQETASAEVTEDSSEKHNDEHDHEHEEHADHEDGKDEEHEHDHEDRPDHYQGEKVESWDQALTQLREKNQELSKMLQKDELSGAEMHKIHRMSYTIENAIGHIRDELERTAQTLEKVHLASERRETKVVRDNAKLYLELSNRLVE